MATQCSALLTLLQMWNVFDTSFVVVFLAYLGFRIKGLAYGDGELLNKLHGISLMITLCSGRVRDGFRHPRLWCMYPLPSVRRAALSIRHRL